MDINALNRKGASIPVIGRPLSAKTSLLKAIQKLYGGNFTSYEFLYQNPCPFKGTAAILETTILSQEFRLWCLTGGFGDDLYTTFIHESRPMLAVFDPQTSVQQEQEAFWAIYAPLIKPEHFYWVRTKQDLCSKVPCIAEKALIPEKFANRPGMSISLLEPVSSPSLRKFLENTLIPTVLIQS